MSCRRRETITQHRLTIQTQQMHHPDRTDTRLRPTVDMETFSPDCSNSLPVLQTLAHNVLLIRRLQVVPPGQQHRRGADGADHQVERLLQVHLA